MYTNRVFGTAISCLFRYSHFRVSWTIMGSLLFRFSSDTCTQCYGFQPCHLQLLLCSWEDYIYTGLLALSGFTAFQHAHENIDFEAVTANIIDYWQIKTQAITLQLQHRNNIIMHNYGFNTAQTWLITDFLIVASFTATIILCIWI